jgi:hypothetical protein
MPYIRVVEGVMYEYDSATDVQGPPLAELGLNAYRYLEARNWSLNPPSPPDPDSPDYTVDFPFLAGHKFRFLNIMAAPFTLTEWTNVVGDPNPDVDGIGILSTYFPGVKKILDEALSEGIGLIMCPIWNIEVMKTRFDTTGATLLDPQSPIRRYMREFHRLFVREFKNHRGVAGWMISQEIFNFPPFKGPPVLYAEAGALFKDLAEVVRSEDLLKRMITTCANGFVRVSDLSQQLTLDEYMRDVLPILNPDPIDTVSQTLFRGNLYLSTDGSDHKNYLDQSLAYLLTLQAAARQMGKPVHIASFGVSTDDEAPNQLNDSTQRNLTTFIEYMGRAGVQLASHWVWNADVGDQNIWNVMTSGGNPAVYKRPEVFEALKVGRALMKAWQDQPIIRQHVAPQFPEVAHFRITRTAAAMFKADSTLLNSDEFSLSYTMRQIRGSQLVDVPFFRKVANNSGWIINAGIPNDSLSIWTGTALGNRLTTNYAPVNVPGRWVRITWTVSKAEKIMRLYVNDFAWVTLRDGTMVFAGGSAPFVVGRPLQAAAPYNDVPEWDLSDVILYKRVLTPQEVFEYGQHGTVLQPAGRWKLNGNLLDSSGHGVHGVPYDANTALPTFIAP